MNQIQNTQIYLGLLISQETLSYQANDFIHTIPWSRNSGLRDTKTRNTLYSLSAMFYIKVIHTCYTSTLRILKKIDA